MSERERFFDIRYRIGQLLERSRCLGLDLARANLLYWLNGSGNDWINYETDAFSRSAALTNELNGAHIRRLKSGIISRLRSDSRTMFPSGRTPSEIISFLGGSETVIRRQNPLRNNNFEEFYIETSIGYADFLASAEGDLANAFGGVTIRSRIGVRLLEVNSQQIEYPRIRIEHWYCKIFDIYDWDYGNLTFLTGLSDEDMLFYALHSREYGGSQRGKTYRIYSREWSHNSPYRTIQVSDMGAENYPIPLL